MLNRHFTSQQVGEHYNQMADYYRIVWGGTLHLGYWHPNAPDASFAEAQDNLTDLMISHTPVGSGHKVLDVGCGFGRPGVRLSEKTGCEVTGITISEAQAEEASRYARERALDVRVTFQRMDAMEMTFPDASFDAVWALECLFHMPDRVHVLRHIARVLRPGGRLCLTDAYEKAPLAPLEEEMICGGSKVNSFLFPDEYRQVLASLGMQVTTLLDISDNMVQSVGRTNAATLERAQELKARYGEEFFAQMMEVGPVVERANVEKIGYFMLAAEKQG